MFPSASRAASSWGSPPSSATASARATLRKDGVTPSMVLDPALSDRWSAQPTRPAKLPCLCSKSAIAASAALAAASQRGSTAMPGTKSGSGWYEAKVPGGWSSLRAAVLDIGEAGAAEV
ncbi:MAG: hypothetical protein OXN79_03250 [bacterium]|nr:hypothetical protein [bacterium]